MNTLARNSWGDCWNRFGVPYMEVVGAKTNPSHTCIVRYAPQPYKPVAAQATSPLSCLQPCCIYISAADP
jgi:hypothetical protein